MSSAQEPAGLGGAPDKERRDARTVAEVRTLQLAVVVFGLLVTAWQFVPEGVRFAIGFVVGGAALIGLLVAALVAVLVQAFADLSVGESATNPESRSGGGGGV